MIRKTAPTSGKWAKKATNKPLIFIFKPLFVIIEPLKMINKPFSVIFKPFFATDKPLNFIFKPFFMTNKPLIFIFKPLSVTIEPLKIINEPLFQTNQGMSQADLGRSKTKDALLQDKITAFGKIWDILDPVWLFDAVNERN